MAEEFQAQAGQHIADVGPMFVPKTVGVGIHSRVAEVGEALLLLHLIGEWVDVEEEATLMVALDTERAVGLIVQLKGMLLDAGVPGGRLIAMMREADARFEAMRAMDRPPGFTCPRCGKTSYNSNDLKEGYCGKCHDWTGESDELCV